MSLSPEFGSIIPSPVQQTLASNYLVFDGAAGGNFAQQYLPEIYEQEVERYGNRTLSGFLRMVGAEMPMTSDQVIWSEQNRLHISYDGCGVEAAGANNESVINIPIGGGVANVVSINDTVVLLDPNGSEGKGIVTATNLAAGTITVQPFANAGFAAAGITITGAGLFVILKYLFMVLVIQKEQQLELVQVTLLLEFLLSLLSHNFLTHLLS